MKLINKIKNLNEKDKNILQIILLIVLFITFIGYGIFENYRKSKQEYEKSKIPTEVTDINRYFTVTGCINKYLTIVNSGNIDNILLLLPNEYKTKNNINKDNLLNYVPKLEQGYFYDFKCKKMVQRKISKNVSKYVLDGYLQKNLQNEKPEKKQVKFIVYLYESDLTFSVEFGE